MRVKRYKVFDDMREVGQYSTLKEIYDTGIIKCCRTYFYKKFSDERCYIDNNICVLSVKYPKARCLFLSNLINRQAKLSPDTYKVDLILTRAVKELTNCVL